MEDKKKNRTYYIEVSEEQEFVYGEDEESCFYYDRECMEEKAEERKKRIRVFQKENDRRITNEVK